MEEDPDAFEEDIKKSRALRDHRPVAFELMPRLVLQIT